MRYPIILLLLLISFGSCKKEEFTKSLPTINDKEIDGSLKINQLQYLGSHNSYKAPTDERLLNFLIAVEDILPIGDSPKELDYSHVSLREQFTNFGIRQIELDLYLDPQGGNFYNRMGYQLINEDVSSNEEELLAPGIKVLHIPDIDFNSNQLTFKGTLQEIRDWSNDYPEHLPIFILLELKEESIRDYLPSSNFTEVLPWDNQQALTSLENEILSVFPRDEIITPDEVRGSYSTLNEAVINNNWPTIDAVRGKVIFLHNNDHINSIYTANAPNLENKLIFTNSSPGNDDAAFLLMNNSQNVSQIQQLVDQGYLVRTRVDAGTYEARNNDYSSWLNGLESGAHFLSTDYYQADPRAGDGTWSNYSVGFNNGLCRNNPVTGQ